MRVLIADDNREIRSALRLALLEVSTQWATAKDDKEEPAPACCTILEAGDATDALVLLHWRDVDVLLLDWELPGFDAITMFPQIRARLLRGTVIAMSGGPEHRSLSLRLGADHFVGKSDPPARLLDLLRGLQSGPAIAWH